MASPAIFWDRDNTLIKDSGYIADPAQVELLPGAAAAIKRLSAAGFQNIIITNQSGIARGKFDEATLNHIHDRLRDLLAQEGAKVDAIYYCPYLDGPEAVVAEFRRDSDLRKPKPGMLLQASMERNIDLAASWSIGNSPRDAEAGRAAGCRTILLQAGATGKPSHKAVDFLAGSLDEAVEIVLRRTRSVGAEAAAGRADGATPVLQEILAFLRTVDRRNQSEDFSLAKLAGAIMQILALAVLVWGVFGLLRSLDVGPILVRLMLALVLQVMALTFFSLSPRK